MKTLLSLALAALLFLAAGNTSAQINPKKLLEKKANEIINKKQAPEAENKPANNGNAETKNENVNAGNKPDSAKASGNPVALESYSKFDFVPGDKVVFYDDFSQGNIGDFPAAWNTNGSGEVVTTNLFPGRWLKFVSRNSI